MFSLPPEVEPPRESEPATPPVPAVLSEVLLFSPALQPANANTIPQMKLNERSLNGMEFSK
jgi:hypothetical protein